MDRRPLGNCYLVNGTERQFSVWLDGTSTAHLKWRGGSIFLELAAAFTHYHHYDPCGRSTTSMITIIVRTSTSSAVPQ